MSMMTTNCVFEASGGNAVDGERHEGRRAVRAAYAAVFEQYPDAHWGNARHFVAGDRGVSEWTFTGTTKDPKESRSDWLIKMWTPAIISVLALISAALPVAQARVDDVEQAIEAFLIPFSNGDVPAFIEFFADDATVFLPPSAIGAPTGRIQGKQDIARAFEALYKRLGVSPGGQAATIRPLDLQVQRFGDVAVVTFHLGTDSRRGRRTFVLRHTGSTWKITHLHASDFRVP